MLRRLFGWPKRRADEAKRARYVAEFQRYGRALQRAQTPEEVHTAVDAYERRKREIGDPNANYTVSPYADYTPSHYETGSYPG